MTLDEEGEEPREKQDARHPSILDYLSWQDAIDHVPTRTVRKKDGMLRRTYSVVESQRHTQNAELPQQASSDQQGDHM